MKTVIQRVQHASVVVDGQTIGAIQQGMLAFYGVEKNDTLDQLDYHVKKLLQLRIFEDDAGKMNRSVQEIGGGILLVSQFTLAGDCRKGNRPGFDNAKDPNTANDFYEQFLNRLKTEAPENVRIQSGSFGADMKITLLNDGPVTFILEN
jgi:D-tyrosyl-tRNA(Tyr) deacylase